MRVDEENIVDDPEGCFEFLIHSLIHNIRIRALENMSDVRFTLGNHDVYTIILEYKVGMYSSFPGMRSDPPADFIHPTARWFFNSIKTRRAILLPFYNNSPYIFLTLNSEPKNYNFIHAGMENMGRRRDNPLYDANLFNSLTTLQTEINTGSLEDKIYTNFRFGSPLYNGLSDKDYSELNKNNCSNNNNDPIIVVGHCPTPYTGESLIEGRDEYNHCETDDGSNVKAGIGCVVLHCSHSDPKVAMVDTASSQAFRDENGDNFSREVEILKMIKTGNTYILERQLNGIPHSFETTYDPTINTKRGGTRKGRTSVRRRSKNKNRSRKRV
jgi:hypothetical protein